MKFKPLALAAAAGAVALSAFLATPALAQAQEQFFPALPYRTGPYGPNGAPWANGYADYLKLVEKYEGPQ